MAMTQEPIEDGGTDSTYKAFFVGLCKGRSPQNMAKNMVISHQHICSDLGRVFRKLCDKLVGGLENWAKHLLQIACHWQDGGRWPRSATANAGSPGAPADSQTSQSGNNSAGQSPTEYSSSAIAPAANEGSVGFADSSNAIDADRPDGRNRTYSGQKATHRVTAWGPCAFAHCQGDLGATSLLSGLFDISFGFDNVPHRWSSSSWPWQLHMEIGVLQPVRAAGHALYLRVFSVISRLYSHSIPITSPQIISTYPCPITFPRGLMSAMVAGAHALLQMGLDAVRAVGRPGGEGTRLGRLGWSFRWILEVSLKENPRTVPSISWDSRNYWGRLYIYQFTGKKPHSLVYRSHAIAQERWGYWADKAMTRSLSLYI